MKYVDIIEEKYLKDYFIFFNMVDAIEIYNHG